MTSGKFPTGRGQSDLDGPSTLPSVWPTDEHSALLESSDELEHALGPQKRRRMEVFLSVVLLAVAVITFVVVLALNS